MIKVASIVWYKVLPAIYGGQKGIALFNQYLSRRVSLTCICSKNNMPATDPGYAIAPVLPESKIQFINPVTWIKILRAVKRSGAGHIILEHPYHGVAAWLASRFTGAKLIIHSHNLEYERFREMKKRGWKLLYILEKWIHRKAMLSLFVTEKEKETAIEKFRLKPGKCIVIPYGIDPGLVMPGRNNAAELIRKRHSVLPGEKILLFAGTLDYLPNAKAAEKIFNEIAPRLTGMSFEGKILVCGRIKLRKFKYLEKLIHPLVIYAGEADDIENYFAGADVFINPVQSGGGMQTKMIDALGYDLPVVCFENMLAGVEESLCRDKLFKTKPGNSGHFCEQIIAALNSGHKKTQDAFYTYYSLATLTEKLAVRLKNE